MSSRTMPPRRLTREDMRRGGRVRAERDKQGREALKAIEEGRLVPSEETEDDDGPCPELRSSLAKAREVADLLPVSLELVAVEPKHGMSAGLLELNRMDGTRRARLLSD